MERRVADGRPAAEAESLLTVAQVEGADVDMLQYRPASADGSPQKAEDPMEEDGRADLGASVLPAEGSVSVSPEGLGEADGRAAGTRGN